MTCRVVRRPDGSISFIACTRGGPRPKMPTRVNCWSPGCLASMIALCDFAIDLERTCDRPMCWAHRHIVAPGVDYCSEHVKTCEMMP